ncbi:MAG: hypothetical protein P1U84_12265 [Parvibaculaceae bacterium]|nr:hypothetical protein [Parvibaculaceae bacterium]
MGAACAGGRGGAGQSSSAIYFALPLITEKRIKLAFRVAALTASKLDFGIYQSGAGWYNQTSEIKSGPGTVGPYSGAGLQRLAGLSDSAWTEVEVTLDAPQSGSALKVYFYPDGATLSAGKSIILDFAQATDAPGEVIISPDLRTNGALVARAPCHPVPVPGVDDTPFIGADESGKLTIALAWSGVPVDTGGSRVLLQAQATANYGTDNGNRLLFYLTSTNRLDLAVVGAGSSSVNVGVSFDDGRQHTAIIEIDRGTGHYGMAVDGGAFVSGSALANMPASLDRITLGHRLSGPTAADHMNGHVTGFAAANALRGYAWNQSG